MPFRLQLVKKKEWYGQSELFYTGAEGKDLDLQLHPYLQQPYDKRRVQITKEGNYQNSEKYGK